MPLKPLKINLRNLYVKRTLGFLIVFGVIALIVILYLSNNQTYQQKESNSNPVVVDKKENEPFACDGDAKICPDGTIVGREGPSCIFSACPSSSNISSRMTTYLGGSATTLNLSVSPKKLISDSRCPVDVTCIWAGTVEVQTVITTPVAHGEHVLKLYEPIKFGDYTVTLVAVTPQKTIAEIPESSYRFTFKVER